MALASDTFYSLQFLPLSDAAWATPPGLSQPMARAIRSGAPVIAFCVSGGDPFSLVFEDGSQSNIPEATLAAPETPITTQLDTYDNGDTIYSCTQTSGGLKIWYSYDSGAGFRKLTDSTALGTLIT